MKKITHEEACKRLQEKGMTLLGEYKGRDYIHMIQCSCGAIHDMYYGNAIKGKGGCVDCFRFKIEFTEERKNNITNSLKGKYIGNLNPNYGKHMSAEAREKISRANFKVGLPKCDECGKQLAKYAANRCKSCNTKGENNPMYIQDRTLLKDGARVGGTSFWRKSVLESQDTCVICGTKDKLHVHHLQPYRDFPELRLDAINGIVLCSQHHRKFHSEYGNKDFTRDNFVEFYMNKLEEIENVL